MPYNSSIVRGAMPSYSPTPGAHPLIPEETGKAPKQTSRKPAQGTVRPSSKGSRRT